MWRDKECSICDESLWMRGGAGNSAEHWHFQCPYRCFLIGFVRLNRLDDAEMTFEEMNCFGIKPNFAILDAKLELLSRRKDPNWVKKFIELVTDGNHELSEATVERLTRFCLYEGKTDELEQLLSLIQGMHLGFLTKLHCGIIRFYAKADRLSDMGHAIFWMLDNGMIFTCSQDVEVVISSYFRHKDFDRLDLFLNRIRSSYKLARSTYDILVAEYQRFNLFGRLESAIKDMREDGFA
ncbi:hypothetical protein ABZP36_006540 [Zizania latifolia]